MMILDDSDNNVVACADDWLCEGQSFSNWVEHAKKRHTNNIVAAERDAALAEVERLTKESHRLRAAERVAEAELTYKTLWDSYQLASSEDAALSDGDAVDAASDECGAALDAYRKLKGGA